MSHYSTSKDDLSIVLENQSGLTQKEFIKPAILFTKSANNVHIMELPLTCVSCHTVNLDSFCDFFFQYNTYDSR